MLCLSLPTIAVVDPGYLGCREPENEQCCGWGFGISIVVFLLLFCDGGNFPEDLGKTACLEMVSESRIPQEGSCRLRIYVGLLSASQYVLPYDRSRTSLAFRASLFGVEKESPAFPAMEILNLGLAPRPNVDDDHGDLVDGNFEFVFETALSAPRQLFPASASSVGSKSFKERLLQSRMQLSVVQTILQKTAVAHAAGSSEEVVLGQWVHNAYDLAFRPASAASVKGSELRDGDIFELSLTAGDLPGTLGIPPAKLLVSITSLLLPFSAHQSKEEIRGEVADTKIDQQLQEGRMVHLPSALKQISEEMPPVFSYVVSEGDSRKQSPDDFQGTAAASDVSRLTRTFFGEDAAPIYGATILQSSESQTSQRSAGHGSALLPARKSAAALSPPSHAVSTLSSSSTATSATTATRASSLRAHNSAVLVGPSGQPDRTELAGGPGASTSESETRRRSCCRDSDRPEPMRSAEHILSLKNEDRSRGHGRGRATQVPAVVGHRYHQCCVPSQGPTPTKRISAEVFTRLTTPRQQKQQPPSPPGSARKTPAGGWSSAKKRTPGNTPSGVHQLQRHAETPRSGGRRRLAARRSPTVQHQHQHQQLRQHKTPNSKRKGKLALTRSRPPPKPSHQELVRIFSNLRTDIDELLEALAKSPTTSRQEVRKHLTIQQQRPGSQQPAGGRRGAAQSDENILQARQCIYEPSHVPQEPSAFAAFEERLHALQRDDELQNAETKPHVHHAASADGALYQRYVEYKTFDNGRKHVAKVAPRKVSRRR